MVKRRLSAILFADIVGYTAMMQTDEVSTMSRLQRYQEVLTEKVVVNHGEIIKIYGDGSLCLFDSVLKAVECAKMVQETLQREPSVPIRIGLHLGDVIHRQNDIYGNDINIASRIESIGVPGSVLMSRTVYDKVNNQSKFRFNDLGFFNLKNVSEPMQIFALSNPGIVIPARDQIKDKLATQISTHRKWTWPVITIILFLMTTIIIWQFILGSPSRTNTSIRSIAVLPLENQSKDPELDYLCEGFSENLIKQIASLSEIQVLSHFSSFTLRDSVHNLPYITNLLQVDAILVGQLAQTSEELNIQVELIARNQTNPVWNGQSIGSLEQIEQMERELSISLLNTIEPDNTKNEVTEKLIDPKAFRHYLQGRFLSYGSSQKEQDLAIEHFHKAIQLEPDYALAYAALANQKFGQARFSNTSREEIMYEAQNAIKKAKEKDPNLPEAHLAQANIHFFYDFDWVKAERSFRKAVALDPENSTIYADFAFFQSAMNRYEEALLLAEKAIALDPISISAMHIVAWTNLYIDPDQAILEFSEIIELHPNWIWGYLKKALAQVLVGDCDAALESLIEVEQRKGSWGGELLESYLAILYKKCGQDHKAQLKKTEVLDYAKSNGVSDPLNIAILYGGTGDLDNMIDWANKCIAEKSTNTAVMQLVKDLDLFYNDPFDDPRYKNLLVDMKFPNN